MVKLRARWIVGSGSHVKVWRGPWLRDNTNPYVQTNVILDIGDFYVSNLIDDSKVDLL